MDNQNGSYSELFYLTQEITGLYLLPFISVFGMIGNTVNLVIFNRIKKCPTNVYLTVMSISDIVKLFNDFMYFLVNVVLKFDADLGNFIFNSLYVYSHYIFVFTAINDAWLHCAIAFDRYMIVVRKSSKKNNHGKHQRALLISISIVLASCIIAVPSPLFLLPIAEIDPQTNSTFVIISETQLSKTNFKKVYNYLNALLRAFVPLFFICYLNLKIVNVVYKKKSTANIKKQNSANCYRKMKKRKSKSSVTLMLFIIILSFIICMLPDAFMTMMQLGYANETYLVRSIREITDLLLAINSTSTFPICFYFSLQYRHAFKELFYCKLSITKRKDPREPCDSVTQTDFFLIKERNRLNEKIWSDDVTVI